MLIKAKTLEGYKLASLDGEIGYVEQFYFDDQYWVIRYLVASTGDWLTGRQVLISPCALVAVIEADQHIAIDLTRKQIEDSPSLDSDKPVSRQFEEAYYRYYGWPTYWSGPNMWGPYRRIVRDREKRGPHPKPGAPWDPNLRSTRAVNGHDIQATDGEIGRVEDFIIDDETWAMRYLVVDTQNWQPGKKVLVSPQWIERVSWAESKVFVNLTREAIRQSPEYAEASLPTPEYEARLHRHYNTQGHWVAEPAGQGPIPLELPYEYTHRICHCNRHRSGTCSSCLMAALGF